MGGGAARDAPDWFARGVAFASLLVAVASLVLAAVRDFIFDRARMKVVAQCMTAAGAGYQRDVVMVRVTNVGRRDTNLQVFGWRSAVPGGGTDG